MPVGRSAVVKLVALCLLAAPGAALAQQGPVAPASGQRAAHRSDGALRKIIIFGSVGAIAGALGSLRVRRGRDNLGDEHT